MNIVKMIEPSKMVPDSLVLGGVSLAFVVQGVTLLTALGGLLLIAMRVVIATQEFRMNRIKLSASTPSNSDRDLRHGS